MKKSLLLSAAGLLALSTTAMYADDVDVREDVEEVVAVAEVQEEAQFAIKIELSEEDLAGLRVAEGPLVKIGEQEKEVVTQLASQLPAEDQPESLQSLAGRVEEGGDLVPADEVGEVFALLRSVAAQQSELADAAVKNAEELKALVDGVLENSTPIKVDFPSEEGEEGEEALVRSVDADGEEAVEESGKVLFLTPGFVRDAVTAQLAAEQADEEGDAEEARLDDEEVEVVEA